MINHKLGYLIGGGNQLMINYLMGLVFARWSKSNNAFDKIKNNIFIEIYTKKIYIFN